MSYTLIFELDKVVWTDALSPIPLILLTIGATGIGLNISRKRRGLPAFSWSTSSDKPAPVIPYVYLGIGLLTSLFTFRNNYLARHELYSEYATGKCEIIEGKVGNLILHKQKGDPPDSFDVWPKHYVYRGWRDSPAFQRMRYVDTPIREDQQVKITDCSGAIVKLEIEKDAPAAQAIVDTPNDPVAKPTASDNKTQ